MDEGIIEAVVDLGHIVARLVRVEVATDHVRTVDSLLSVISFPNDCEHL